MKDNGYHTEVKQQILQRNKRKRHNGIRAVAESKTGRVPVEGLDAHKIAWEILDDMEE